MGEPCDRCEELLQDFLDRTLTDAEWREAETHLGGCDYCRRRYRFEESLRRYVRTSSVERMPPGLMDKLSELRGLDATTALRTERLGRVAPSATVSTSPGAPRSSHGTSVTGRSRSPSSGTCFQSSRPRTSGWPRAPAYEAATIPPLRRHSSRTRSTAAAARSARPRARRRRPRPRSPSAASPQRSDAPGFRVPSPGQCTMRMPCDTVSLGTSRGWAPSTTTISSTEASREPLEHAREEESAASGSRTATPRPPRGRSRRRLPSALVDGDAS